MGKFGQKTDISPNCTKQLKLSIESKTLLILKCFELVLFRSASVTRKRAGVARAQAKGKELADLVLFWLIFNRIVGRLSML